MALLIVKVSDPWPSACSAMKSVYVSRFKLLESRLESTLQSSLEIKEEKICALEARLQESSNLNQQLRQELKTVRLTHTHSSHTHTLMLTLSRVQGDIAFNV